MAIGLNPGVFHEYYRSDRNRTLAGWLTGKAVEVEGRVEVVREGHVLDAIYGIAGAMVGEYLFFWIVIGKGNAFSDFATAVLGSVTIVGVARLIAAGRSPLSSK